MVNRLEFRKRLRVGQNLPETRRALEGKTVRAQAQGRPLKRNVLLNQMYEKTSLWIRTASMSEEKRAEAKQELVDSFYETGGDLKKFAGECNRIRSKYDFTRL